MNVKTHSCCGISVQCLCVGAGGNDVLLCFVSLTGMHRGSCMQEQDALVKELTEVLQRQKTRVSALQKERTEMSAQLATYHPAEQDKLRGEVGTLRERVRDLAGLKVRLKNSLLPQSKACAHCFSLPTCCCVIHITNLLHCTVQLVLRTCNNGCQSPT